MGDRPIGFQPEMVKALLAGRKTMTRRLAGRVGKRSEDRLFTPSIWQKAKPGDRLWVRETWRPQNDDEIWMCVEYQADMARIKPHIADENQGGRFESMCERAEASVPRPNHWKSSRYMPRWASRITLTVTAVKIERLHAISNDEGIAEGAKHFGEIPVNTALTFGVPSRWSMESPAGTDQCLSSPRWAFANYWIRLHGQESWDANPDVVAMSFTVHKDNIDHAMAGPRPTDPSAAVDPPRRSDPTDGPASRLENVK